MLSLFYCIVCSLSVSLEEIKLIAIFNQVFHVSNFRKLVIIYSKYGLTLLIYSSIDNFCLYHYYFHIRYNWYYKSYQLLLLCNNLQFLTQKGFEGNQLFILSVLFSFFSLKVFFMFLIILSFDSSWIFDLLFSTTTNNPVSFLIIKT